MKTDNLSMNLSPSATAFALGSATFFHDTEVRNGILKTVEIAGSTVSCSGTSHYLLTNYALVGEAIMLAMRTTINNEMKKGNHQ